MNIGRFLFILLLCGWLLSASRVYGCEFKMATYAFKPLAMQDKHKQWIGLDHDYAKALASLVDCTITPVVAPWGRAIDMLKRGSIDLMVGVSKTDERAQYFYFVGPQRIQTIFLVSRPDAFELVTSWQQLSKLNAVLMRQKGSYFGARFEQMLATNHKLRNKMLELADNEVRLALIHKGRVDGFLADEMYIDHQNKINGPDKQLQKHPLFINRNSVYYAFSKAAISPEQIKIINTAFSQLSKTKGFKAIADKYR